MVKELHYHIWRIMLLFIFLWIMGRPPKVQKDEIISLIIKYIAYFKTKDFPCSASDVWKQMSNDLGGRWLPHSVYTHIVDNKNGNLAEAREMCGIFLSPPLKKNKNNYEITTDDQKSNMTITDNELPVRFDDDFDTDDNLDEFPLILTAAEWEKVKPDETSESTKNRLKPRVWANIIFNAFWRRYKMPCAFKGEWSYANISENSFFIKFRGICTSKKCLNRIIGIADTPLNNEILNLRIQACDTRFTDHENVKRPLNGEERRIIGEQLKIRRPAGLRRKLIRDNMQFGEDVPPIIQNSYIYRQAKMEAVKRDMGIQPGDKRDQVTIVRDMVGDPKYAKTILDIGAYPFHVIYCSQEQVFVYKEYCRIVDRPKICADATGKLIKKFEKCPKVMTGHIFLYTVTINFEKTTIPVYQMITERQDADFLIFWLKTWIRKCKVRPPAESVSDEERALVLAQCMAFNGLTIKQYVDKIFLWAVDEDKKQKEKFPVVTMIRLDVAHFVAAAARWKCLNDNYKFRTKRFYLRVIALMIDCQTVAEFRHIFILTCLVALTPVNDYRVKTPEFQMTAEEARKKLEEYISTRDPIVQQLENEIEDQKDSKFQYSFDPLPEEFELTAGLTVAQHWIDNLISSVTPENPEKIPGTVENAFYLPPLVVDLQRVGKEFPLWTNVAAPKGIGHASSAYQEGYFNDVKHRVFEHVTLPCVCHRFLKIHLEDILSGNCLVAAKLKQFNQNQHNNPYSGFCGSNNPRQVQKHESDQQENIKEKYLTEIHDSDFVSRMQWRGIVNQDKIAYWQHVDGNDTDHGDQHIENLEMNINISSGKDNSDKDEPRGEFQNNMINTANLISNILDLESCNRPCFNDEEVFIEKPVTNDDDYLLVKEIKSSEDIIPNTGSDTLKLQDPLFSSTPFKIHSSMKSETIDDKSSILKSNLQEVGKLDVEYNPELGIPKKNKKRGGYFDPYPQIKILNERGCPRRKEFFLPNGIQCPVVKCDRLNISVINTCAFDSIVHILQFAAIDDSIYFSKIKSSKNKLLQFVWDFLQNGPTTSVLYHRCTLLNQFYPLTSLKTANSLVPYQLNAKDGCTSVWEKLSMEPSGVRKTQCSNDDCEVQKTHDIRYLVVNHKIIAEQGFQSLDRALQLGRAWKCRQIYCDGTVNEIVDLNDMIFIELDIRTNMTDKVGLPCKLSDIPRELNIGKKYRLIGVIDYRQKMNHFIAYCHRMADYWLACDDLSLQSTKCSANIMINPVCAMYLA